jgi:hypothetical protein
MARVLSGIQRRSFASQAGTTDGQGIQRRQGRHSYASGFDAPEGGRRSLQLTSNEIDSHLELEPFLVATPSPNAQPVPCQPPTVSSAGTRLGRTMREPTWRAALDWAFVIAVIAAVFTLIPFSP